MRFNYTIKTANEEKILSHLRKCNANFIPPLNKRTILYDYSKKIFEKSITFEAWEKGTLTGLICAYFNDTEKGIGYITNVSTVKYFMGKGIASTLLNMCIKYGKQHNFKRIELEVSKNSFTAIKLYNKIGFHISENKGDQFLMTLEINNLTRTSLDHKEKTRLL